MSNEDERKAWDRLQRRGLQPCQPAPGTGTRRASLCRLTAIPRLSCTPLKRARVRCVRLFRGMFAFAVWDSFQQILFYARDRLGVKTVLLLLLGRHAVRLSPPEIKAFASGTSGISGLAWTHPLPEYTGMGYTSGELMLFSGIRKLMLTHTLTFGNRAGARPTLKESTSIGMCRSGTGQFLGEYRRNGFRRHGSELRKACGCV